MAKGLLDALYWRLHTSYLRNERSDSIRFLEMIEDEISKGKSLLVEIGPIHFERFSRIQKRIKDNSFSRLYGTGNEGEVLETIIPVKEDISEKEFCERILKDKKHICNAIGASLNALVVTELDVEPYGRIDVKFFENRVVKILEVKVGEAKSSLVSQIDKYRVALELDLCLGLYDQVEAYVLANKYDKYVLSELTRASVVVLAHDGTPESIRRIA